MKKVLGLGALALTLVFAWQQQASAWTNSNFAIGTNLHWQSGNNSILWGLWRDGQVPHSPGYGPGGPGLHGPQAAPAFPAPAAGGPPAGPQTAPSSAEVEQAVYYFNSSRPVRYAVPQSYNGR